MEYVFVNNLKDLVEKSLTNNIDVNAKSADSERSLLEIALSKSNKEIINLFLTYNNLDTYLHIIVGKDFDISSKIVEKFPNIFDSQRATEHLRGNCATQSDVKNIMDLKLCI